MSTMRALMTMLNIKITDPTRFCHAAGFIIEFRETVFPEIRYVIHYPNPYVPDERRFQLARNYVPCTVGGAFVEWCPFSKIREETIIWRVKDPDKLCGVQLEPG